MNEIELFFLLLNETGKILLFKNKIAVLYYSAGKMKEESELRFYLSKKGREKKGKVRFFSKIAGRGKIMNTSYTVARIS